ncbi:hypothetical protein [Natronococcus jeotgali]|uniref:Small CPxCG-related zinc finger protein n=1 Tax=Natronococcus jeotgali DSM 18795 TaxID=1227498 RepID=L9WN40_9EURY|nr:hypothetical protein [Natronococcus jeotgali]ELY50812.1 hypothetical protein C492_21582 [Natronococcus jeotgali DSM 18795]
MNARCPECSDGLGELVGKRRDDGDVSADFECPGCGHEWEVTL